MYSSNTVKINKEVLKPHYLFMTIFLLTNRACKCVGYVSQFYAKHLRTRIPCISSKGDDATAYSEHVPFFISVILKSLSQQ